MTAEISGDQIIAFATAGSIAVGAFFTFMAKMIVGLRKTAEETNRAVNNVPPGSPTTRELLEELHADIRDLRREGNRRHETSMSRHAENVSRLKSLDRRLETVEVDLKTHMREMDEDRNRNTGDGK